MVLILALSAHKRKRIPTLLITLGKNSLVLKAKGFFSWVEYGWGSPADRYVFHRSLEQWA